MEGAALGGAHRADDRRHGFRPDPIALDHETATLSPGRQGIVLSGTITCTADIWAISSARVIQGQRSGFGSLFSQTCTGEPQEWSLVVVSGSGLWHPGRASAAITVIWQGAAGFGQEQLDRFVHVVR